MLLLNARALDCGRPPPDATLRLALANAAAAAPIGFPFPPPPNPPPPRGPVDPPGDERTDFTDVSTVP